MTTNTKTKKVLLGITLVAAFLATLPLTSFAQQQAVNTEEGACEDSTCSRRVMSLPATFSSSSSTSSTVVSSSQDTNEIIKISAPAPELPGFDPVFSDPPPAQPALVTPAYDGKRYDAYSTTNTDASGAIYSRSALTYSSSGTWSIVREGNTFTQTGPLSGSWLNTSSNAYEYRVTLIEYITGGSNSSYIEYDPTEPNKWPTPWKSIGPSTVIAAVWDMYQSSFPEMSPTGFVYSIEVRPAANPATIMRSKVTLYAESNPYR